MAEIDDVVITINPQTPEDIPPKAHHKCLGLYITDLTTRIDRLERTCKRLIKFQQFSLTRKGRKTLRRLSTLNFIFKNDDKK